MAVQEQPKLGDYLIKRELSRDGFGIVYQGVHASNATPALLRVLPPDITNNENFSVRWELLKSVLPKLTFPNLLQILSLNQQDGIAYIVKALPFPVPDKGHLPTLAQFDYRKTQNRQRTLEQLFDGVALALATLEDAKEAYFKDGILLDTLSPDRVYLAFEPTATGDGKRPIPKVDGFAESFLFFGDQPQAMLHHRIATPLFHWKNREDTTPPEAFNLYQEEGLHSIRTRRGKGFSKADLVYSFGSLLYQYVTGRFPKGIFPPLVETDSALDPQWDEMLNYCLSPPSQDKSIGMRAVVERLRALQSHHAKLTPIQKRLRSLVIPEGMTLVLLNDKVTLGASDGKEEEGPAFKARIQPFLMDVAPVTVAQFKRFLKSFEPSSYSRDADHPATNITWHMAKAYCRWRSEKEGLPPDTYRLPTEYEWEAAVRGQSGDQYPWGNEPDPKRMYCDVGREAGAAVVKGHAPGRFGLYDMLGNVWEWTESAWGPHPVAKRWTIAYDPTQKVVKGGCWYTPIQKCRASARAALIPNQRRGNVGFRCVRLVDLSEPSKPAPDKEKKESRPNSTKP